MKVMVKVDELDNTEFFEGTQLACEIQRKVEMTGYPNYEERLYLIVKKGSETIAEFRTWKYWRFID
jgi:dimeric dUTPase (all-alpha-NTP-PPase superfamily)